MDLKEMLNEVLSQSGFITRTSFVSSSDPDDKQMVSIANRVLKEMRDFYPWSVLRKQHAITMAAGQKQYDLPSDFHAYIADSGYQGGGTRPIELPVPDGRWYMYKNSAFSDGGTYRCRLVGKKIEVADPDDGQTIVLEYLSDSPAVSSGGVYKKSLTADTDNVVFSDQTFILGVQAHWAETKLLPQAQRWMGNYMSKMNNSVARDSGGRTIGGFNPRRKPRGPYTPLWRA